jgi:hypothetical protein
MFGNKFSSLHDKFSARGKLSATKLLGTNFPVTENKQQTSNLNIATATEIGHSIGVKMLQK